MKQRATTKHGFIPSKMIWTASSYSYVFNIFIVILPRAHVLSVVQAGLFSASLTSFLIDNIHNLQVDPAQQMVYYQQQNVALLAQISNQLSSIAPQVSIPSAPLPPYDFSLNPSDVRINAFWFMSLVFSLSAALLATLVQQWVRNYMHVFQRYGSPLKSARLRQYLYEGAEGWYMPLVAKSVPSLLHVSLFLFFVGLRDLLFAVNTTVGISTIVPIAICGLFYVFSMFAPIIKPQSPFRNPFSGLIWYLKQKVHPRRYLDHASGGSLKPVNSNLSEGQMQLAMEENDEREDRDVRAIRWLIHNRTEDDEMESFVMAIPGAFTSKRGINVWRKVSEVNEDGNMRPNDPTVRSQSDADPPLPLLLHHHSPPFWHRLHSLGRIIGIRIANGSPRDVIMTQSTPRLLSDGQAPDDPYEHRDLAIYELCRRVRHLVDTCNNSNTFTNLELWLKRARGCIGTAASLVICADIEPELFGDIGRLLPSVYDSIKPVMDPRYRSVSAPGSDGLFIARFCCLAFVIVYRGMANHTGIKLDASDAIDHLSRFRMGDDSEQTNNGDDDEDALRNARRIDVYFETARQFCLYGLRGAFRPSEVGMTERVREVLHDHEVDISMLDRVALAVHRVANIDGAILRINDSIRGFSDGLIRGVRGANFDECQQNEPLRFLNPTDHRTFSPQFVFLYQRLQHLCSYSDKLRDIVASGAYQETLKSLETLWDESDKPDSRWGGVSRRHLMERQLWRLQDLRDGGGFGFWVELFFPVVEQILGIPLSPDTHSALILGMFRIITSNWRQHKHSIGTQRVILNLVCDLAILDRGLLSDTPYPKLITDELLVLLKNMVEGQSGSHIDDALKELEDAIKEQVDVPAWLTECRLFRAKAVKVLSSSRAPRPSS
jgi:hypothetical protein